VPHLRNGFIVAKVGIRAQREPHSYPSQKIVTSKSPQGANSAGCPIFGAASSRLSLGLRPQGIRATREPFSYPSQKIVISTGGGALAAEAENPLLHSPSSLSFTTAKFLQAAN